jgi:hypothetical protein
MATGFPPKWRAETFVYPHGRSQGAPPDRRHCAIRRESRCAYNVGMDISSGVSAVA